MVEVVRRLPVVEDLVAVLDGRTVGGNDVGDGEDGKGGARLQLWRLLCAGGRRAMRMLAQLASAFRNGQSVSPWSAQCRWHHLVT